MADTAQMATEKLTGKVRDYFVNEGTATAVTTPPEYDWGMGDLTGYTYASPIRDQMFVQFDTTADFTVKRAPSAANGNTLVGIAYGAPQGKAGQTRSIRVIHFQPWDVLRLQVDSGGTALAVGDKFSLYGTLDTTLPYPAVPHSSGVTKDATNGIGYALNAAQPGEYVAVLMKPGTF